MFDEDASSALIIIRIENSDRVVIGNNISTSVVVNLAESNATEGMRKYLILHGVITLFTFLHRCRLQFHS